MVSHKEKVKALKRYTQIHSKQYQEWADRGYPIPAPAFVQLPEICRGMRCEAKTRSGEPCKNSGSDYGNGRCKHHGGASTGPVTKEGKKRASMNAMKTKPM